MERENNNEDLSNVANIAAEGINSEVNDENQEVNEGITEAYEGKKHSYKELLAEKQFLKNLIANVITRFGDGIDSIAFSWLVYEITGSVALVATIFAVNGIPNLLFGMVSGVVVNYYPKKLVMTVCDFGRGIGVAVIALLYMTGNLEVWHLFVITFLNSSFESFRGPASTSLVPSIISKERLHLGVGISSSLTEVGQLIGIAIAPLCIGLFGLGGAVIIDAATFMLCGLVISTLKYKEVIKEKVKGNQAKEYLKDFKEGFSYVKNSDVVRYICILGCAINFLIVPINALQAPYVAEVLKSGTGAMSIFGISFSVGMAISSVIVPKLLEKLGARNLIISGGIVLGIAYVLFAVMGNVPSSLMLIALSVNTFLMGFGVMCMNIPVQVSMFKTVSPDMMSRVSSIMVSLMMCAMPIGSFIVGGLSVYVSIQTMFIVCGIATTIMFLLQFFSKALRKLNEI